MYQEKAESKEDSETKERRGSIVKGRSYVFLGYAAQYWAIHFRSAQSPAHSELTVNVAEITCCPLTHISKVWRSIYNSHYYSKLPVQASALMLASFFGFYGVVERLLADSRNDLNGQDSEGKNTFVLSSCKKQYTGGETTHRVRCKCQSGI